MDKTLNIALLGGSFDPPHQAHREVAKYLLGTKGFDEVWIVPARQNPFKKTQASFEQRVAMCRLLFGDMAGLRVLEDEAQLSGYTIDLARHLRAQYPGHRFVFVGGSDLKAELPRWKEVEELGKLLEFEFVPRPPDPASPFPAIRSTEVRERVKKGLPIADLLPKAVEKYIRENQLYNK